ncbi:MAG: 30S ribosomal protein S6 [Chitinophagaceae bacterium]|jgi:small subunit ribosomal protein S6|nr:MAG: 30S ribosomal protein S6 [Chitinophagaceae bacterium]
MTDYELMVIFTPVLSEDEFKSAQNNVVDFLKENGGTPVHSNPWGLRSLAFSIHKKTTGLYWVLEYQAPNDLNEKLKIQLNRDETVLRYLVTRLDKYAAAYNLKKRTHAKTEDPGYRTGSPKPVEA